MHEVIWHGRGGQGVVLAAQLLATAAYLQGFKGVTSAPTFGPERRGAPLTASTRMSPDPIRTVSQIERANIAVVLDESLLGIVNISGTLQENGTLIINTTKTPDQTGLNDAFKVATVDALGIAHEKGLKISGTPIVNTPMLGAFARATDLVSIENIEKALAKRMTGNRAASNFSGASATFEKTIMGT